MREFVISLEILYNKCYNNIKLIKGLNLYAYCLNNPIKYCDPTGHFVITALIVGILVGAVVGAGTSIVTQGVTKGWDNINWAQVGFDSIFGALSVGLAMTGIGFWGSVIVGGLLGGIQYVGDSHINDQDVTLEGFVLSVGLGALGGAFSGAGARNATEIGNSIFKFVTKEEATNLGKMVLQSGLLGANEIIRKNMIKGTIKVSTSTIFSAIVNCI